MRHFNWSLWVLLAVAVLLSVTITLARQLRPTAFEPPPEAQYQAFSISSGSAITTSSVHPSDVLGAGINPLIVCDNLGLLCFDPVTGALDDIRGLSYGSDFTAGGLPQIQFSVAPGSRGLTDTAVRAEADCSPAEPQADVFEAALDGQNYQDLDGNGTACSSNNGFGLDLGEGASGDNLDEIALDPCLYVDANCDGDPEDLIFVTLAPGSPTLSDLNANPSDILLTGNQIAPGIFASGVSDLGLQAGDVIDALCVREDGDGLYDSGDLIMFSLAAGSPSLTTWQASAADLLTPRNQFVYRASTLGLQATDDIDGLQCSLALNLYAIQLPIILKSS
jgi:hypothetical protein